MSRNKKWGVSAIFATGAFACICSIMRVVSSVRLIGERDLTYGLVDQGLWANGEVGSGIVAGCMLSLPQLFHHVVPKVKSLYQSKTTIQTSIGRNKLSNPSNQSARTSMPFEFATVLRADYLELEERGFKTPPVSVRGTDGTEEV